MRKDDGKFSEKSKVNQHSKLYLRTNSQIVQKSPSSTESFFIVRHGTRDKMISIDLHVVNSSRTIFFPVKTDNKWVVLITNLDEPCFSRWSTYPNLGYPLSVLATVKNHHKSDYYRTIPLLFLIFFFWGGGGGGDLIPSPWTFFVCCFKFFFLSIFSQ